MLLNNYEKKHLAELRPHLAECTVLLRREDEAFPLEKPCRLALFGSGARRTVKGGTGSGEVNSRFFVTVEQGLKDAGFLITTNAWLDAYEERYAAARKAWVRRTKKEAHRAGVPAPLYGMGRVMPEPDYEIPLEPEGDAAVYVLARISGEGSDREPVRGDVKLTETEIRDILTLNACFEKFMLVLNVGGPVDLSEIPQVRNILLLSQLGVETGTALAQILLGQANPSGHLTTSWSAWEDYPRIGDFGDRNDTHYREGIYVGYRYFDSIGKKALFPFGFGLSYTSFARRLQSVRREGTRILLTVTVKNTGRLAGREVLQLYLSLPQGRLDQPFQKLAAFEKTDELEPGAEETLSLAFDLKDQAAYDTARAAWILEAGEYILRLGTSSRDTEAAARIALPEEVTVRQLRNALGEPDFEDWKPEPVAEKEACAYPDLPMLLLKKEDFETETVSYERLEKLVDGLAVLSDDELIRLNIGAFDPKAGLLGVIGDAGLSVAGAAGETTLTLRERSIPSLVMADGPAGLRLAPRFWRDKKGAHSADGGGLPDSVGEWLPAPVRAAADVLSSPKKMPDEAKIEYQYCTAVPIGTALAQSWNIGFAALCGDIVGAEMERFGVQLWLAPALNIHRSVLCGRNFEYFSEDPLISGKMAAALTRGVQLHPGCGVTVKHFAANNQENNRYGNNSQVSERAMREIYLKGFEIAVKEAQPAALMTSYNLLNGIHTAERRDLIWDVLRCEFGFEGIVMTDWIVSFMADRKNRHPKVSPRLVAAAGGELFMPGSKADFKDMRAGLREGSLSRAQLERNASRLLKLIRRLTPEE
ncbi:MAG: glycoside hydrolase family 3 C-terminal domain-containing protein [Lachnospiraceae bacterium]|nr:glycoside hydrolase family 3 C-terminal domain-containing protein [Lachnospiraceae bacterium]